MLKVLQTNSGIMKKPYRLLLLMPLVCLFLLQACIDEMGDDPFADPVLKFLGEWKAEESTTIYGQAHYKVTITRNPSNFSEVLISNFYLQGDDIKARALVTGNVLTIMRQKICDDTIEINGTGTYIQGRIQLQYTAHTGADLDQVTAVYTR